MRFKKSEPWPSAPGCLHTKNIPSFCVKPLFPTLNTPSLQGEVWLSKKGETVAAETNQAGSLESWELVETLAEPHCGGWMGSANTQWTG